MVSSPAGADWGMVELAARLVVAVVDIFEEDLVNRGPWETDSQRVCCVLCARNQARAKLKPRGPHDL